LHSTRQAYKGRPHTGVFLQITCDNVMDLTVPGQKYTFGVVQAVQARGDFHVFAERGRRVRHIQVGKDVQAGLAELQAAVQQVLT
jgi:transaldolase/glucose-6-phosphate isomerase